MTMMEYKNLRSKIEERYQADLAALDRIWQLFRGDDAPPAEGEPKSARDVELKPRKKKTRGKMSDEERKNAKRAYMRAWYAKRHGKSVKDLAHRSNGDEKVLSKKAFSRFLVEDPLEAGGNGAK